MIRHASHEFSKSNLTLNIKAIERYPRSMFFNMSIFGLNCRF